MFIPVVFSSVNSQDDLESGAYRTSCALYGAVATKPRVFLFEYIRAPAQAATAYDIMIVEPDGQIRARDFVWMPDRCWRDSDGLRATNVLALMPAELEHLALVRTEPLDDVRVIRSGRTASR